MKEYQKMLYSELERRKTKNENYSLRAFARDIGISSSRLSEILNDKQGLSKAKAMEISKKLKYNRQKQLWFSNLVEAEHSRSFLLRKKAKESTKIHQRQIESQEDIPLEKIHECAHWYYFALRRLTESGKFQNDLTWIADKLNISEETVKTTLNNLLSLGILSEDENGTISIKGNINLLSQSKVSQLKENELKKVRESLSNIYKEFIITY